MGRLIYREGMGAADEEALLAELAAEEAAYAEAEQAAADYRNAHPEEFDPDGEDNDPRSMGWVNDRGLP